MRHRTKVRSCIRRHKGIVSGMYFYNDSHLSCAASGRVFAAAEYINSSMVACRMPVSSASTITLQLSSDGNNFVSVKDTFTYVQKIVVSASKPPGTCRRGNRDYANSIEPWCTFFLCVLIWFQGRARSTLYK